jgi:hypothetical protein
MKTLKLNDKIIRVADNDTNRFLQVGYTFIPKSEWKNKVRDANKKTVEVDIDAEAVVDKKLAKRLKLKEKQDGTRLY